MSKFRESKCVALRADNPALGLLAGNTGKIWAVYDSQPPSYEVTFADHTGSEFDALMYEDELDSPEAEQTKAP